MKTSLLSLFALFFIAALQAGPVTVTAQEKSSKKEDAKKHEVTQDKQLTIKLDNTSREKLDDLSVKFSFYGKNLVSKSSGPLNQGEIKASIPAGGTTTVQSEHATSTYTERYMSKGKAVDASGEKLSGFSVQVFKGSELVGEYYSSQDLKQKAAEKH